MKTFKTTLILLFLCVSLLVGYAQNFSLTDKKGAIYPDGETISRSFTESDLNESGDFIFEIFVQNNLDIELEVKSLRTNLVLVNGMNAYVCFYVCDDTLGTQYAMDCFIYENNSASYALHLRPHNNFGLSQFKFEFWSEEDQSDKQTLYVNLEMQPLSVKEQPTSPVSLSAYPNPAPANSTIHVSYTLADKTNIHRLIVRNIMGAEVINLPLNPSENTIAFDAAELKAGVYFYTIETNHRVTAAKKLIVK
jgi:hypothetical protein